MVRVPFGPVAVCTENLIELTVRVVLYSVKKAEPGISITSPVFAATLLMVKIQQANFGASTRAIFVEPTTARILAPDINLYVSIAVSVATKQSENLKA